MTHEPTPWYRRTLRWGQTNITEIDPTRYDIDWWRKHWRRTCVQGVILNAGGIVAYYPSRLPLHHRAEYLGERDLLGELIHAARAERLAVLARMDSNRAHAPFYEAHPDWFAIDAQGQPYRAGELYIACIHSPYYEQFIPEVLREICAHYRPDGFADNSWSGLGRDQICYCRHCRRSFAAAADLDLPPAPDWDDPAYRRWIRWSYDRRLEVWDLNNRVTQEAGGPHCLWIGMNSGDMLHQAQRLRDTPAICARSPLVLLDHQGRNPAEGFQGNGDSGKRIHELAGWDVIAPESMAMYQHSAPTFRVASRPAPEARMWMVAGFAGGIQPWWHHIGAYHEDRRQYRTAVPVMQWHAEHQAVLHHRTPCATVGVVWSQENGDFYGRDEAGDRVQAPYRGIMQALIRARIPYLPIHADAIAQRADDLALLILPNVGALSDAQVAAIRRFVAAGGGLLASGEAGLYDEQGQRRPDFALGDLLGIRIAGEARGTRSTVGQDWSDPANHSYLRLHPELRAGVDGPHTGHEPPIPSATRHPALAGFEETDLLPFGGRLERVQVEKEACVPLTWVPPFPIYPPETAWMREPDSGEAALVVRELPGGARVAYLAASLDASFAYDNLPDHGDLLANLVRWAAHGRIPLDVQGPGLIDCHLYRQAERLILHLVNLSHTGAWRPPLHELLPIGPLRVRLALDAGAPRRARLLVAGEETALSQQGAWVAFEVPRITDHEVIVIE